MTQISIIIPAYNAAQTVGHALESVLAQTFTDFEILVIDDGSQDGTQDVVKAYCAKDERVRLITYERNAGVSYARNKGIQDAKGKWIALLDADDWFGHQRLERLALAGETLNADIVFDNLKVVNPDTGEQTDVTCFGDEGATSLVTLQEFFERDTPYMKFAIGYSQPMLRRSFINEHNVAFNESYTLGEDFTFFAECLIKGAETYVLPFADYYYLFSPVDRTVKPDYAVMDNKYDQVIASCEDIMLRYKDELPAEAYDAIKHRRDLFKCLSKMRTMRRLGWSSGILGRGINYLRCPSCFTFLIRILFLRFFKASS